MNKELEALEHLYATACYEYGYGDTDKQCYLILKEALKRNEPMKPIKYEFGGFQCPACGGLHCQSYDSDLSERNLNFCDDCGQKLDWSDEK